MSADLRQLRTAIAALPDSAGAMIIETEMGARYRLVRAFTVGTNTDDPGLVMQIRYIPEPIGSLRQDDHSA